MVLNLAETKSYTTMYPTLMVVNVFWLKDQISHVLDSRKCCCCCPVIITVDILSWKAETTEPSQGLSPIAPESWPAVSFHHTEGHIDEGTYTQKLSKGVFSSWNGKRSNLAVLQLSKRSISIVPFTISKLWTWRRILRENVTSASSPCTSMLGTPSNNNIHPFGGLGCNCGTGNATGAWTAAASPFNDTLKVWAAPERRHNFLYMSWHSISGLRCYP